MELNQVEMGIHKEELLQNVNFVIRMGTMMSQSPGNTDIQQWKLLMDTGFILHAILGILAWGGGLRIKILNSAAIKYSRNQKSKRNSPTTEYIREYKVPLRNPL